MGSWMPEKPFSLPGGGGFDVCVHSTGRAEGRNEEWRGSISLPRYVLTHRRDQVNQYQDGYPGGSWKAAGPVQRSEGFSRLVSFAGISRWPCRLIAQEVNV